MGRLLVLVVLVVLAVWLVRRAIGKSSSGKHPSRTLAEGELVRCAHCGVHLPRNEARQAADSLYCSEEHARLGKR